MSIYGLIPKPEGATWTDDQWSAITARGDNLLVAAAAGSGKTAVLVERLIRMVGDETNPIDVDRLLVATFTKAASEEMRHRIREALEKKLASEGESEHIARQLALLPRASITTLHAFCMDIVRRNFVEVGLDPNFRIGNEIEIELLRQDVLETVLEQYYANNDAAFYAFVESFTSDRSDSKIYELILELHTFSQSHPWPEHWLRTSLAPFKKAAEESISVDEKLQFWTGILLDSLKLELESARGDLQLALQICMQEAGLGAYVQKLADELGMLDPLLEAAFNEDWEVCGESFAAINWGRLPSVKKDEVDEATKNQVTGLRDGVKKALSKIQTDWFGRSAEEHAQDITKTVPILEVLIDLTLDFAKAYEAAKREKAIVDFNDLEHYTLHILRDASSTPEKLLPSAVAKEYQERFAEVLLDEYQDTNQVQEAIVQLLSKTAPGNRFMVGDVKQSIYRFRLAEPGLFLKKYEQYEQINALSGNDGGVRIDLARNFRSRRQVVDGINFIFRQLMQPEVAEINYDDAAELKLGATYPEATHNCEVVLIQDGVQELSYEEEDEEELVATATEDEQVLLSKTQKEARFVANRIHEYMEQGFEVYDGKAKSNRKLQYRDIVILVRSPRSVAPVFEEELKLAGIPCYAELNTGYFAAVEVETMVSLLHVVDNPNQDIALAAVLRSPLYGLTTEQLAQIRVAAPKGSFYEAVLVRAQEDALLQRMLTQLERWRDQARSVPLSEFLWSVYRETGYYDGVGGWSGGVQRQANLRALIDRAKQFEASSYRGLFRFLRFIERLRESGSDLGTAQAISEREDVVRIMSIHKSKGLEFPVVFLSGVSKKFNEADMRVPFMMHRELGFGPKAIDPVRRISYPTLAHQAIGQKMRKEMLAEEMRILYVALTRAKEKLIITGTVGDSTKQIEKWARFLSVSELQLPQAALFKGRSYLDWLGPALIRHPHAKVWRDQVGATAMNLRGEDPSEWTMTFVSETASVGTQQALQIDPTLLAALRKAEPLPTREPVDAALIRQLNWQDPEHKASTVYAKISVSELKRMTEDPTPGDELVPPPMQVKLDRPKFLQEFKLTPTERGTAYHTVMQHMPFEMGGLQIPSFMDNLVSQQLLTEAQRQRVDAEHLQTFVKSPLYTQLAQADAVYRELPFSLGIPAGELHPELSGDSATKPILMQGVIDCLFEIDGNLHLLDYKTDRVTTTPADIGERYRKQLELYARAIEQMTGRKVAQRILYLFDGGHTITV